MVVEFGNSKNTCLVLSEAGVKLTESRHFRFLTYHSIVGLDTKALEDKTEIITIYYTRHDIIFPVYRDVENSIAKIGDVLLKKINLQI